MLLTAIQLRTKLFGRFAALKMVTERKFQVRYSKRYHAKKEFRYIQTAMEKRLSSSRRNINMKDSVLSTSGLLARIIRSSVSKYVI